jgi:prepilin-type N-terminal cleavage/methylation domain-containing protein
MRMTNVDQDRQSLRRGGGFTLIELLTVMAIISILLTVASVGISGISKGTALASALTTSEALFSEARSTAIGAGTRARLVIHNDLDDKESPERYLRYLAIAVEEKDEDGNGTDTWKIASRGSLLPAGVYFDVEASRSLSEEVDSSNSTSGNGAVSGFGEWALGTMDFPGPPMATEQSCYYYEFNAEGICIIEGTTEPGAAFVVSEGNRPLGKDPILDKENKSDFVIWRSGSSSLYKSIKDLQTN